MRSAIFPRIHRRWKSSRNKERGTFANGDCTQCAHVGAAIPQLVTYVPLVTGGRSREPLAPPAAPCTPNFCANPFIRTADDGSFHPARHSRNSSTTKTRATVNTTRKDKLTFVKLRTSRKYSLRQGRARSSCFRERRRIHSHGSSNETCA